MPCRHGPTNPGSTGERHAVQVESVSAASALGAYVPSGAALWVQDVGVLGLVAAAVRGERGLCVW